jgi:gas vesicle protein GvpL/GvpF
MAELLWAYCVLRGDARADLDASVERIEDGGLAALVSRVPEAEFAAKPLRRNLNDLDWLERVARSHEALLHDVLPVATIVPLRLCTIFENEESVRRMLDRERPALERALGELEGRQEWGAKLLADPAALRERVQVPDADAEEPAAGAGAAYLKQRRAEREIREEVRALARDLAEDVHERLAALAVDAVTRPPQNRDLSRHEGEMLLNAAYLVESARVDELRGAVAELEERYAPLGARVELTGPWPPYNFVPSEPLVV